jgi:putative effector of murein hydrolase LrgA (UPF0299 family)
MREEFVRLVCEYQMALVCVCLSEWPVAIPGNISGMVLTFIRKEVKCMKAVNCSPLGTAIAYLG